MYYVSAEVGKRTEARHCSEASGVVILQTGKPGKGHNISDSAVLGTEYFVWLVVFQLRSNFQELSLELRILLNLFQKQINEMWRENTTWIPY